MKKFLLSAVLCSAFCLMGSSNADAQTVNVPTQASTWRGKGVDDYYKYFGPDLDLQVGAGYHWDSNTKTQDTILGMGRLRVGMLWIPKYPYAISLGITQELNTNSPMIWGVQGEIMLINSGLWLRVGTGVDYTIRPHFNTAVGWSLLGVEIQTVNPGEFAPASLNDHREGVAILGTVRIPFGFIFYALR